MSLTHSNSRQAKNQTERERRKKKGEDYADMRPEKSVVKEHDGGQVTVGIAF